MARSFRLEVVTPERLFYEGDVELVIARTLLGDEGFMANHAWACKLLATGELWIQEEGQKDFRIAAISGGFIDVKNEMIIFTDAAEWPSEIDIDRSREHKESAEEYLKTHSTLNADEAEIVKAKVSLSKAITRMGVAAGGMRRKRG